MTDVGQPTANKLSNINSSICSFVLNVLSLLSTLTKLLTHDTPMPEVVNVFFFQYSSEKRTRRSLDSWVR